MNNKINILLISFIFLLGCNKNQESIVVSWKHPNNDFYIEFTDNDEAFIETNTEGEIGGILSVLLNSNETFINGVENKIKFQNIPKGLIPETKLNSTQNELEISFSGKAEKHGTKDSKSNISITIPAELISGRDKPVLFTDIKILFHNVPCIWKSPETSKEYLLVFNDEFNGDKIDKKRWKYRAETKKLTRTITYNQKKFDIVVEDDASVLEDGNLILKVYKKWKNPQSIFTGGILTLDKFMAKYGYFETLVSFENCTGFGYWPSFWVYFEGKDKNSKGTEIDILEYIPAKKTVYQTLHWYINNKLNSSSENFVLENLNEYHRFGLEWTPDELIFYVDGKVTRRMKKSENERFVPEAYQMVYLSMSAGTWGGNVADPANKIPASSKYDYCRVYQTPGQDALYKSNLGEKLIKAEDRRGKY